MALNIKKDALELNIKGVGATPNMITTKEELNEVSKPGTIVDSVLVKEFVDNLSAGDDTFVFDYQGGKYGFNTDPARGADTFHAF